MYLTLYWVVRSYRILIFVWALLTWVPGVAGSTFHNILGIPLQPLLYLFGFLHIGFLGLELIIPLILLGLLESWLVKQMHATQAAPAVSALPPDELPLEDERPA
jgi:hypothetical protein